MCRSVDRRGSHKSYEDSDSRKYLRLDFGYRMIVWSNIGLWAMLFVDVMSKTMFYETTMKAYIFVLPKERPQIVGRFSSLSESRMLVLKW